MPPGSVSYTFLPLRHSHLYVCDACGAVTDDPEAHADWHEGNPIKPRGGHRVTVNKGTGALK